MQGRPTTSEAFVPPQRCRPQHAAADTWQHPQAHRAVQRVLANTILLRCTPALGAQRLLRSAAHGAHQPQPRSLIFHLLHQVAVRPGLAFDDGADDDTAESLPLPPSNPRAAAAVAAAAAAAAVDPPSERPSRELVERNQSSARFRLQQELASRNVDSGDDSHRQVARKQMAMHLRMSDATANKALALSHIQHPLAPEPWQPREHDGSRRCLLSPNASSAPSAPSSPRIGTAHSASPRGRRDARSAGAASARTGSLLEAADRPAAAGGDGGGGDGRVISARGLGGSEGIGAARPHHHILEDIYLPPPTPPPRVRVTGQVIRRGPLYGDPGVSNEAVEAMFGKQPPEYGRAIPPDAINMHTIQQIDTSYKRAVASLLAPVAPSRSPLRSTTIRTP